MYTIFAGTFDEVDFGVWGIVFGIFAVAFMLLFWVLPFVLSALGIKNIFVTYQAKNPNSFIAIHGKSILIVFVALIPLVYILFRFFNPIYLFE